MDAGITPGHPSPRKIHVFLVEDHLPTAKAWTRFLEIEGFQVTHAPDVETAMSLMDVPFDVVLCDITLPDGYGWDVMREVCRRKGTVPGFATSALNSEEDMKQSLDAGFLEHLVKPIDILRLVVKLRQVGEGCWRKTSG